MTAATKSARAPTLFALLAGYLILKCLWRLFVPGGSFPLPPWHFVSMGLDALLLVVLIAMKPQIADATPDAPLYVRHAGLLFWGGVVAGAVMLGLRFTSTHSWWTGHLLNGN